MNREDCGIPPDPEAECCANCGADFYMPGCPLCEEVKRRRAAEDEVARFQLLAKLDDWVKADAARFRWLQEHTVAAGLGRFIQQHRTQFLAEAVDAATKAENAREDLMSVERGRKVGELTRNIRKQQGRQ